MQHADKMEAEKRSQETAPETRQKTWGESEMLAPTFKKFKPTALATEMHADKEDLLEDLKAQKTENSVQAPLHDSAILLKDQVSPFQDDFQNLEKGACLSLTQETLQEKLYQVWELQTATIKDQGLAGHQKPEKTVGSGRDLYSKKQEVRMNAEEVTLLPGGRDRSPLKANRMDSIGLCPQTSQASRPMRRAGPLRLDSQEEEEAIETDSSLIQSFATERRREGRMLAANKLVLNPLLTKHFLWHTQEDKAFLDKEGAVFALTVKQSQLLIENVESVAVEQHPATPFALQSGEDTVLQTPEIQEDNEAEVDTFMHSPLQPDFEDPKLREFIQTLTDEEDKGETHNSRERTILATWETQLRGEMSSFQKWLLAPPYEDSALVKLWAFLVAHVAYPAVPVGTSFTKGKQEKIFQALEEMKEVLLQTLKGSLQYTLADGARARSYTLKAVERYLVRRKPRSTPRPAFLEWLDEKSLIWMLQEVEREWKLPERQAHQPLVSESIEDWSALVPLQTFLQWIDSMVLSLRQRHSLKKHADSPLSDLVAGDGLQMTTRNAEDSQTQWKTAGDEKGTMTKEGTSASAESPQTGEVPRQEALSSSHIGTENAAAAPNRLQDVGEAGMGDGVAVEETQKQKVRSEKQVGMGQNSQRRTKMTAVRSPPSPPTPPTVKKKLIERMKEQEREDLSTGSESEESQMEFLVTSPLATKLHWDSDPNLPELEAIEKVNDGGESQGREKGEQNLPGPSALVSDTGRETAEGTLERPLPTQTEGDCDLSDKGMGARSRQKDATVKETEKRQRKVGRPDRWTFTRQAGQTGSGNDLQTEREKEPRNYFQAPERWVEDFGGADVGGRNPPGSWGKIT